MRCPDCNKFVSMDNADPEVNQLDAELDGGMIRVTSEVRCSRQCAECGTDLKELNLELDTEIMIVELSGFKELSPEDQTFITEALADMGTLPDVDEKTSGSPEFEVDIEESSSSIDEGGGGRFKKNMLTTHVEGNITVTVTHPAGPSIKFGGPVELESENAASEFDECC